MRTGTLFLIPVPLGDNTDQIQHTDQNSSLINTLSEFIVEDLRTARRHLKLMGMRSPIESLIFHEIGKHSNPSVYNTYLKNCLEGNNIGLLSDAGCPGIADPGAEVVRLAHTRNIRVAPLVGPSSILLALMASGSNGQQFCFHGYLPINRPERIRKIKELEQHTRRTGHTQLFIETPFRNNHLLEDLLKECNNDTLLCIACDLTQSTEFISTKHIKDWKEKIPDLHKRPAVFLICS
jgi:16S rRNA (cytidine1402-2'-O)-methyltransferase